MIKFFKNIRRKQLTDLPANKAGNRFNKYLLYAIGEIILVVIGILIALQINNWNEHQRMITEEQKVLKALKAEIKNNIENLKITIEKNLETQRNQKLFLKIITLKNIMSLIKILNTKLKT